MVNTSQYLLKQAVVFGGLDIFFLTTAVVTDPVDPVDPVNLIIN